MLRRLLTLIPAMVVAHYCCAQGTNSPSSLESRLLGTWRWMPAQADANAFMKISLAADRSWSWVVEHNNPMTHPDSQSGTWFLHDRVLVLRVDKTDIRLIEKMAYALDIGSIDQRTLFLTNSSFGDMTWTRIAQPDGAANRSQDEAAIVGSWQLGDAQSFWEFRADGGCQSHGEIASEVTGRYKFLGRDKVRIDIAGDVQPKILVFSLSGDEMTLSEGQIAMKFHRVSASAIHLSGGVK